MNKNENLVMIASKQECETPVKSRLWRTEFHGAKRRDVRIKTSYSSLLFADY